MTDFVAAEEYPVIPFHIRDESGEVVFRDSLTFPTMVALRNASAAERQAMMRQRYEAHQALLAAEPREEPVEPEDVPPEGA